MSASPSARRERLLLIVLLSASLALRAALFPLPGYATDLDTFAAWHAEAATNLSGFYGAVWSDYPPLNIHMFALIGRAEGAAGLLGSVAAPFDFTEALFLKLPQNLVDLGVAALLFLWLRPKGSRIALAGAAAYAFNPATMFNLAVWGQWDSLYTLFMAGALVAVLRGRPGTAARWRPGWFEASGVLLALAVLTKPQGVLVMPVIAYLLLREGGLRRAVTSGLAAAAAVLAVIAPFQGASNPVAFIAERYFSGYDVYKETSLNAYNLWALAGMRESDQTVAMGLPLQAWGWLAFLAIAGLLVWKMHTRYAEAADRDLLLLQVAFLTVFAFFMVATRIHERYLFPVFALLALMWPRGRLLYAALTGSHLFNLAYALHVLNSGPSVIRDWTIPVVVGFNLGLFAWVLRRFWKGEPGDPGKAPAAG
ncbi:MAG: glycosyltransferase family 39 protein [Halobacteria archaeon]